MKRSIPVFLVLIGVIVDSARGEDMQKYLSDTQSLVDKGDYKEALDRFLWFHDHALEHNPAMYGVRLSFALVYWKQLGEVYPPALAAMKKVRDDKTSRLTAGKGSRGLFHDVTALNNTLNESAQTVDLFVQLDATQKELASECWDMAADAVIEAKKYELARNYIGDPVKAFAKAKAMYDGNVALYSNPLVAGAPFKTYNENSLVEKSLQLMEVALASDDWKSAQEIQRQALAVIPDDRLRDAIRKQEANDPKQ